MVKNIELEQLIINKLTQAQYDALAVKNPGELYFITDATPTKEIETQLAELSKKVPEPISTYESFPEATAENVGLRVVYTGETIEAPSIENENASVSTVFLDPYLTRGHTFMLVPVELSLDTESTTVYMWQDVNGAIPPISDDTSGKMLSNNGITYEWTEVVLGEKLPDQTDNAGKFLTTDGENASWSEALVNLGAGNKNSLWLGSGTLSGSLNDAIVLYTGSGFVSVGNGAIAIGAGQANGLYSVCINGLKCAGDFAIQLGGKYTTNPDANTFKVGNANGNFEMMDANGNVPLDRLTYVTDQIGDISTALTSILGE